MVAASHLRPEALWQRINPIGAPVEEQAIHRVSIDTAAEVFAAVDLGSNSFHMIVAESHEAQLTVIDRLRETIRLSEGLRKNADLSVAARQRALDCLVRFGERLKNMRAANVRAVGTNAFRRARDCNYFLKEAQQALGHPIEVISGIEEARLIYGGVTHTMPVTDGTRLVLDVGGGSTELILGEGPEPQALESLEMGCVTMSERYFVNGRISHEAFANARTAARLKLRPVKAHYRGVPGVEVIGTSGTIRATEAVACELGLIETRALTRNAVEALIERVQKFDYATDISLPGLSDSRSAVWPGGLAILVELLAVLRIDRLHVADGALREGLLYESLGRSV